MRNDYCEGWYYILNIDSVDPSIVDEFIYIKLMQ